MLILDKARLVVLEMPKTASQSLRNALSPFAEVVSDVRRHAGFHVFGRDIYPKLIEDWNGVVECCCVVREPLSRAQSWYRYRQRDKIAGTERSTVGISFDDYIEALISDDPPPYVQGGRQSLFTGWDGVTTKVDHVFDYENLDQFLEFLGGRLGAELKLPIRNQSTGPIPEPLPANLQNQFNDAYAADYALYRAVQRAGGYFRRIAASAPIALATDVPKSRIDLIRSETRVERKLPRQRASRSFSRSDGGIPAASKLVRGSDLRLASDRTTNAATEASQVQYFLLHIGRTGGTSLGTLIRRLKADDEHLGITKLGPRWTLLNALKSKSNSQIGFVIRDPVSRFVSGFNSRRRSGRPAQGREWNTHEAVVYAFFPTANDLAESLCSDDERLKSAAQYAMKSIIHLRRGYSHYLRGLGFLEKHKDRIYCVCNLDDLNNCLYDFFAPLGVNEEKVRRQFQHLHRGTDATPPLSELALRNLKIAWKKEFEIYEYCRKQLCINGPAK